MEQKTQNPLGTAPVSKLMVKFAVPSIVAMLVGALYNIVDQFFIGQKVGIIFEIKLATCVKNLRLVQKGLKDKGKFVIITAVCFTVVKYKR